MTVKEAARHILGMNIMEAQSYLETHGMILRVMDQDGEPLLGTCDLRLNRLNVAVEGNKVVGLLKVG